MGRFKRKPVVCLGTMFTALALAGTCMFQNAASNNVNSSAAEKTMNCSYEVHKHQSDCYDAEGNLTCGYADWVVHTHDENCYIDGKLVCELVEHAEHVHSYSCYAVSGSAATVTGSAVSGEAVTVETDSATGAAVTAEEIDTSVVELVSNTPDLTDEQIEAFKEELAKYRDTLLGYASDSDNTVIVSTPEPTAAAEASDEAEATAEPTATPELEETHEHTDDCYVVFKVLTCTDTSDSHEHDSSCYITVEILACSEASTSDDAEAEATAAPTETPAATEEPAATETPAAATETTDSSVHTHIDDCYISVRVLTCGKEDDNTHNHTDDCYENLRVLTCDYREAYCGEWELHTHTDDCFVNGVWVCGKLQLEAHQHDDGCFGKISSTSTTKDSSSKNKKNKSSSSKGSSSSSSGSSSSDTSEVVKTGDTYYPTFLFLLIALISGGVYFFQCTSKGQAVIAMFKKAE